jgi:putative ABC transport system permease protein
MLQNYFRTAWRNLTRNKVYSFINITGIAIGLAAFWLISLYVGDELSYDRSFTNAGRIYRIAQHANWEGGSINMALNPPPLASAIAEKFPEVEQVVRMDAEGGGVIKFNNEAFKQGDIFFADNNFFKIFDHTFLYGHAASALTQPNSTVITESLAKKIFGDASRSYNQTIYFGDSEPVKITGVIKDVPQNSHLQFSGIRSMYVVPNDQNTWKNFYMYDYILLKKGIDVNAFEKKLNAFGMQTIAKEMGITDYRMELQP